MAKKVKASQERCSGCGNSFKGRATKLCPNCTFLEEEGLLKDILRFSAKALRQQRKQFGLSAEDYGKLVFVSGSTIRSWEVGKTSPRNSNRFALAGVRDMSKPEALKMLQLFESEDV
jgi:DNA-binding transcriptional regulator YiaG